MAKEQPSVTDCIPFLASVDLQVLEDTKNVIQEHLQSDRGSILVNSLVDYYLNTSSSEAVLILSSVIEPHDKHLLDKMNECMGKQNQRLLALTLLGHVIRKQPPWIHKIVRFQLFASLLKCLKTDADVVVLTTGVLVLIVLLPMIPQPGKQLLYEFFDIFGRLAAWNQRNPGHVQGVYLIHLHAAVYSLFHRLYGMYPCNFVSYLRSHYNMRENLDTFDQVVKQMLENVRIHPELIIGNKDSELDPSRWRRFEAHDIVIECAKVSLDPKEASWEEGYSTMPDQLPVQLQPRPQECASNLSLDISCYESSSLPVSTAPLFSPHVSASQPPRSSPQTFSHQYMWSPSSVCGMTTPPNSRGISPTNISEVSQNALHLSGRAQGTPVDGRYLALYNSSASSSPNLSFRREPELILQANTPSSLVKNGALAELHKATQLKLEEKSRQPEKYTSEDVSKAITANSATSMSLKEVSAFIKEQELEVHQTREEREEDAIREELQKLTESKKSTPAMLRCDTMFYRSNEIHSGTQEKLLSCTDPSPFREPPNLVSTPDRPVTTAGDATNQKSPWSPWPCFTPINSSLSTLNCHSSCAHDTTVSSQAKFEHLSGLFKESSLCYEPLFDLALPKVASLFVEKKTSEALQRARGDKEQKEETFSASSPLEVLDFLLQQSSDSHDKLLKSGSASIKLADVQSGGKQQNLRGKGNANSAPLDELHVLRSQVVLLHNQLQYERYKREQHAIRNRRLLRRVINATALQEQNHALKEQLKLQEVERRALQLSLQEEQQRYQQLLEDRKVVVTRLQEQVSQLERECSVYSSTTQALQSELKESEKQRGELEADLQKAKNKVCNTGHLLSQLTMKLMNSESMEQQMAFLNKHLLLLGEANKLCVEEMQRLGPDTNKELKMLQGTQRKECERLRQAVMQQSQWLEASQKRISDLEGQLTKKEHLILEQKKFLEDTKAEAKNQLQASENRYLAQKHITQMLQSELLRLYSEVELYAAASNSPVVEAPAQRCNVSNFRPNGNRREPELTGSQSKADGGSPGCLNGGANHSTSTGINGGVESPATSPVKPTSSPTMYPSNSPLIVGSSPSAGSVLGRRSQELFRNNSESQHEEGLPPLTGLSQELLPD
ncbi:TSC complex subunit 1a isoform X2 [Denticeps clupeoides]|uniref:TSC complex subunit 1a isoform X2 n=1 Tax=Denticeps clupeoides TaxID=299321 RepID=UPI0010A531CA|nr:hamartin-like isoform X2 [Denticeps clupeoides]